MIVTISFHFSPSGRNWEMVTFVTKLKIGDSYSG